MTEAKKIFQFIGNFKIEKIWKADFNDYINECDLMFLNAAEICSLHRLQGIISQVPI